MIASVLMAIGMVIGVLVEVLLPSGGVLLLKVRVVVVVVMVNQRMRKNG